MTKIIKSSQHTIKFANIGKQLILNEFLAEYDRVLHSASAIRHAVNIAPLHKPGSFAQLRQLLRPGIGKKSTANSFQLARG